MDLQSLIQSLIPSVIAVTSILISQHRDNAKRRQETLAAAVNVAALLTKQEDTVRARISQLESLVPLSIEIAVLKGNKELLKELNGSYVKTPLLQAQLDICRAKCHLDFHQSLHPDPAIVGHPGL